MVNMGETSMTQQCNWQVYRFECDVASSCFGVNLPIPGWKTVAQFSVKEQLHWIYFYW